MNIQTARTAFFFALLTLTTSLKVNADLIPTASLSIESNALGERTSFLQVGMVNGSGLPAYEATALHAGRQGGSPGNFWLSSEGNTTGAVIYDLGGTHLIDTFFLWNGSTNTGQQLNEIQIETSLLPTTGFTFTSLGSGLLNANTPGSFNQGEPIPAVPFAFTPVTARYFRLTIVSNNGSARHTSIAEVAFNAVPEPSAFPLALLSAAIISTRRVRSSAR